MISLKKKKNKSRQGLNPTRSRRGTDNSKGMDLTF